MSNCSTYPEFLEHFGYLVDELHRLLLPGRLVSVHCMDLRRNGNRLRDFPGDIVDLFEKRKFVYHSRHCIWKEPLRVYIRTRALGLSHKQVVRDSSLSQIASPDYILTFRKRGKNPQPIIHPEGLSTYAGEREPPRDLVRKFQGHANPRTNKLSHWIWQQYASPVWMDIRLNHILPYKESKEPDDEKHICALQRDVVERCLVLWSNPGDIVLTPFLGVGTEVYEAVRNGRRGIGVELKRSYFRQAARNLDTLSATMNSQKKVKVSVDKP